MVRLIYDFVEIGFTNEDAGVPVAVLGLPPRGPTPIVGVMRTSFLLLGACVPIAACSADLVTAPKPAAKTATTVIIRGASSLRGSSPIFIVDGVVVGRNDINPGDIESVEIIKGASATSLYGTMRCPAIVITTRRAPSASEPRPAIHEAGR